jgi:mono/diheme cytochrome c family protein
VGGVVVTGPVPQSTPPQPPEGESRAPADNGAVPDGLAAVVGENCLRCHGANNAEQGGSFDLRDLKSIPLEDRAESYTQVVSGEMPRKSNTLSKEHQLLFKDWYRAAVKARRTRAAEATASNGRVASSN